MAWQHECVTQVLLACYKAIFQKGHVQFDLRAAGFMPISQLDCTFTVMRESQIKKKILLEIILGDRCI